VWFRRPDLPHFLYELLILYSVTNFAYVLPTQGNEDLSLLEMDQEVFPAVLPSKVTEVEGCIRMYEEMHRLKGKVKKKDVAVFCPNLGDYYIIVFLTPLQSAGGAKATAGAARTDGEGSVRPGK